MEHPNNPRKELGDLEELTESIRIHGVMQNLLVIDRKEALEGIQKEYEQTPHQQYAETMDALRNSTKAYVVLLGHRRLNAAYEAGLDTVPCVIESGLTLNEQITLMLLENMQRNNLTIVEEAESFQMMLDLGDTVATVAEKSGFSETTVRHRTELARLDKKKLEKALKNSGEQGHQLTLTDLAMLEKVDDVKERNKILDNALAGYQIKHGVERYVHEQQKKKHRKIILDTIEKMTGKQLSEKVPGDWSSWSTKYMELIEIDFDINPERALKKKENKEIIANLPADAFLVEVYHDFVIYAKNTGKEKKLSKEEQARKEKENRIKEIKKITKARIKAWADYCMEMAAGRKKAKDVNHETALNVLEKMGGYVHSHGVHEYCEMTWGSDYWELKDHERIMAWQNWQGVPVGLRILIHIIGSLKADDLVDWTGEFQEGRQEKYIETLKMLETIDYREDDEEFAKVLAGKSELFTKR